MLACYVYSQSKGTVADTSAAREIGGNAFCDPNDWLNADGWPPYDPTHVLNLQGSCLLPLGVSFNASFVAITGDTWTRRRRTGGRDLYQRRLTFNVEQAGKCHYPMLTQLDLRLEKIFTLADKYRLGGSSTSSTSSTTTQLRAGGRGSTTIGLPTTPRTGLRHRVMTSSA